MYSKSVCIHPNEVFLCVFSWLVFLFLSCMCASFCYESIIAYTCFNVFISHLPIISFSRFFSQAIFSFSFIALSYVHRAFKMCLKVLEKDLAYIRIFHSITQKSHSSTNFWNDRKTKFKHLISSVMPVLSKVLYKIIFLPFFRMNRNRSPFFLFSRDHNWIILVHFNFKQRTFNGVNF